jgi:hypothetical protein
MIVIALAVAFTAPAPHHDTRPQVPPTSSAADYPYVVVQDLPSELIIHFRGRGPLARAERARSATKVAAELSRQRAFHNLCFSRFDSRGVVVRDCNGRLFQGAEARLRAVRGVASVERGD